MRLMGIDFGSKRVGVALSDEGGEMAFPRAVLPNNKELTKKIKAICIQDEVRAIIIGESKSFSGKQNLIDTEAKQFAKAIEKETSLKVFWEPEYLTSAEAKRLQGKNDKIDASAAALILKSYIEKNKNGNN